MPGKNYQILYAEEAIKEDIPALPKTMRKRIQRAIEERLMRDPLAFGKPLRYSLYGQRRLRVGDYRVIYWIERHQNTVHITSIKHRKDVYDD